jgi:hypothetical protein
MTNIFFNAAHSPIGACASFTLGFPGAAGGLGIELGKPAEQNVYIGLENARNADFQALPFFQRGGDDLWTFEASAEPRPQSPNILKKFKRASIRREFSAATDIWTAGDLTLKIISPILPIPDPASAAPDELKPVLLPAVYLQLSVDNRRSRKARTAFIGWQGDKARHGMRRFTLDSELQGVGNRAHRLPTWGASRCRLCHAAHSRRAARHPPPIRLGANRRPAGQRPAWGAANFHLRRLLLSGRQRHQRNRIHLLLHPPVGFA